MFSQDGIRVCRGAWHSLPFLVAVGAASSLANGPILAVGVSRSLPNPIVFVQQEPVTYAFATIGDIFGNFEGYYPPADQPVGGNLYRLDPDATLVNLTRQSQAAVRDPEISFDGLRIVFAMKQSGMGKWQIYEIGVDGSGLRKVSRDPRSNDLDPSYLADGRIVFTTDRKGWADSYENLPSAQLAVMNADGSGSDVLKQSPGGHFNPLLGADGKIYLTQWDLHDRRDSILQNESDFAVNRFLPWQFFPDGSGHDHPAFGTHTLYDTDGGYVEIREVPQAPGTYLAVLAEMFFTFGGGSLVRLEPHENQDLDEPIFITENVFGLLEENRAGRWRSPYPLSDGRILASYAGGAVHIAKSGDVTGDPPHWGLVVMNGDGTGQTPLFEDKHFWSWQPVEVVPRPVPPLRTGDWKPQYPYAIVNSRDVTLRGSNEDLVRNGDFQPIPGGGEIETVRFYRENYRSPNFYSAFPGHADPDTEVLGTAPVAEDGSFAVVVPADVPLTWELLDATGQVVVRERYGTELRAGEVRQCDGCHTPHDGRQGRQTNLAMASPTNLSGQVVDRDKNGVIDLLEHRPCEAGASNLCLNSGRFNVEVTWKSTKGELRAGHPKTLTDDTGYFWFFSESNVELVVKVLDGRGFNQHFWVFYGALSNLEYTVTVTDTDSGEARAYTNPAGSLASMADSQAFGPFPAVKGNGVASADELQALLEAARSAGGPRIPPSIRVDRTSLVSEGRKR